MSSIIPLGKIFGDKSVRVTPHLDGGERYLSVRDTIMVVCDMNAKRANEAWQRLSDEQKDELTAFCGQFQFSGRGQSEQPVITFQGALKLIMMLPGETAKKTRSHFAEILTRYYAGDSSLHAEVEANAAAEGPVNLLAREALPDDEPLTLGMKRFRELEYEERRLSLREREARLEAELAMIPVTVKERELAHHHKLVHAIQSMCPGNVLDDRTRLLLKDRGMNLILGENARAIANGETNAQISNGQISNGPNPDGNPKSVSDIAAEMGKAFRTKHVIRIGVAAAEKYRERYGPDAEPPKHPQWVNGRTCAVNHYVEKDHDLVREAVREYDEAM